MSDRGSCGSWHRLILPQPIRRPQYLFPSPVAWHHRWARSATTLYFSSLATFTCLTACRLAESPMRPACLERSDGFVSSPRRLKGPPRRPRCRVGIAPTDDQHLPFTRTQWVSFLFLETFANRSDRMDAGISAIRPRITRAWSQWMILRRGRACRRLFSAVMETCVAEYDHGQIAQPL